MQAKTFKLEKSVEMDLMKSILSEFQKFKQFYSIFGQQKNVWLSTMNADFFQFLKVSYEESGKPEHVNEANFYTEVFDTFQLKHPNYDLKIYEDLFEKDFDFEFTLKNYVAYFKRKEIILQLESLTENLKSTPEIDFETVQIQLKRMQVNWKKSSFWQLEIKEKN